MPVFLICIIVFVIWFRVKLKHNNSTKSTDNDAFWEREKKANFARRKDIESLSYLVVPDGTLPFASAPDELEQEYEQEVLECSKRKMLNLSAFSNTDLKEQYGVSNLEELSNCDQNFLLYIRALSKWGTYLYEQDDYSRAKQIMEYSLSIGSDISSVYVTLGNIYAKEKNFAKVDELIYTVENSDFALKSSIIKQLKLCKLEY